MARELLDYMRHAGECRRLASVVAPREHRRILLRMAETWEMLAADMHDRSGKPLPRHNAPPLTSSWPHNK